MTRARYLVGDVHEALATLPEGSVDLVLTSPPFLALRSYLPDDHPDKAKEIGSEPTPAEFIDALMPRARTTSTTPQQAIELNWPFPWETQR